MFVHMNHSLLSIIESNCYRVEIPFRHTTLCILPRLPAANKTFLFASRVSAFLSHSILLTSFNLQSTNNSTVHMQEGNSVYRWTWMGIQQSKNLAHATLAIRFEERETSMPCLSIVHVQRALPVRNIHVIIMFDHLPSFFQILLNSHHVRKQCTKSDL